MGRKKRHQQKQEQSQQRETSDSLHRDRQRTRKSFNLRDLRSVQPLTKTQATLFDYWNDDPEGSLFLYGSAGTGKTFTALYLALNDLLDKDEPFDNIIIVRSTVPTRDLGFLPGDLDEKIQVYEEPYRSICDELFTYKKSYDNMKEAGLIRFMPTAFLRGATFDNSIIVVDEMQNMTFQELDTIMTRIGQNSKVIFSGDIRQSDLENKRNESSGFQAFKQIIDGMTDYFQTVEFKPEDIVRSGIVKKYILEKEKIDS